MTVRKFHVVGFFHHFLIFEITFAGLSQRRGHPQWWAQCPLVEPLPGWQLMSSLNESLLCVVCVVSFKSVGCFQLSTICKWEHYLLSEDTASSVQQCNTWPQSIYQCEAAAGALGVAKKERCCSLWVLFELAKYVHPWNEAFSSEASQRRAKIAAECQTSSAKMASIVSQLSVV